jgi:hypothetical protein
MRNHCRYPNIQDLLTTLGYTIDHPSARFQAGAIQIPFAALRGHSVSTFVEMARTRGWLDLTDEMAEQPEPNVGQYGWCI